MFSCSLSTKYGTFSLCTCHACSNIHYITEFTFVRQSNTVHTFVQQSRTVHTFRQKSRTVHTLRQKSRTVRHTFRQQSNTISDNKAFIGERQKSKHSLYWYI